MDNNTKNKPWWQPAIIMFARVSVWVAIPIIGALFIGKYLDKRYSTAPWIFIILTGIAFMVSMFGIWKILRKYIDEIEKEAREKKNLNKDSKENNGTN